MYEEVYGGVKGYYSKYMILEKKCWHFCNVGVTEGVEKATIEDDSGDKKDRTVVKDKSAKLEAKLERENKKKMVRRNIRTGLSNAMKLNIFNIGFSCTY